MSNKMIRAGQKNHILRTGLRLITGITLWTTATPLALASDFIFDLDNTGTTPISVQVTVHQQATNTLRFTIDQNDPDAYGDLRYLFLQVNETSVNLSDLNFSFVSAVHNDTGNIFSPNFGVETGLNSVNIGGFKNYDIALKFGRSGIGTGGKKKKGKRKKKSKSKYGLSDDIRSITFDIINTVGSLNQMSFLATDTQYFMAARVTSSWDGINREGSSKLNCCGTTTVAAPESTMGLLVLALGGLLWRRKFSSQAEID